MAENFPSAGALPDVTREIQELIRSNDELRAVLRLTVNEITRLNFGKRDGELLRIIGDVTARASEAVAAVREAANAEPSRIGRSGELGHFSAAHHDSSTADVERMLVLIGEHLRSPESIAHPSSSIIPAETNASSVEKLMRALQQASASQPRELQCEPLERQEHARAHWGTPSPLARGLFER